MKKWAERMDQPRLMKGFSLKCTAAGSRKKIKSLISSWSSSAALLHLVPLFLCSPPAFDSRMHTVELHHKLYGTFTSECRKVFCQSDVISWDASHNGCHCCSQWDSRMSCCHAKLLRNVCARGQTFCVSGRSSLLLPPSAGSLSFPVGCGISCCRACFRWSVTDVAQQLPRLQMKAGVEVWANSIVTHTLRSQPKLWVIEKTTEPATFSHWKETTADELFSIRTRTAFPAYITLASIIAQNPEWTFSYKWQLFN